jgi:hypothetical protein
MGWAWEAADGAAMFKPVWATSEVAWGDVQGTVDLLLRRSLVSPTC